MRPMSPEQHCTHVRSPASQSPICSNAASLMPAEARERQRVHNQGTTPSSSVNTVSSERPSSTPASQRAARPVGSSGMCSTGTVVISMADEHGLAIAAVVGPHMLLEVDEQGGVGGELGVKEGVG